MVFPWGGKQRIVGNNPLAYAFPADKCLPVVLDFSLSVVSSGKLILCRKKGEAIPLGWAVDKEGVPTEDPYEGDKGGEEILVPGEPEHRTEMKFLKEGVPLPPNMVKELIALAGVLSISHPLQ